MINEAEVMEPIDRPLRRTPVNADREFLHPASKPGKIQQRGKTCSRPTESGSGRRAIARSGRAAPSVLTCGARPQYRLSRRTTSNIRSTVDLGLGLGLGGRAAPSSYFHDPTRVDCHTGANRCAAPCPGERGAIP